MIPYDHIYPQLADTESLFLDTAGHVKGLPNATFHFREYYCDLKGCDCRRVFIHVYSDLQPTRVCATISHGFDPPDPSHPAAHMGQTFLDPMHPQSKHSARLRKQFIAMLDEDGYGDTLVRHYEQIREIVDDPEHPKQDALKDAFYEQQPRSPMTRIVREPVKVEPRRHTKIPRNAPCPCGSGKKYKKCCGRSS